MHEEDDTASRIGGPAGERRQLATAPVLLAEDDRELRGLIAGMLREDGFLVLEACDGLQLLDRIEAAIAWGGRAHPPISLVISDVRMPGMSGVDVLAILRCAYWKTPVILVSAFADATLRREARELGASAVLAKPFELEELRSAVHTALWRPLGSGRGPSRRPDHPPG
jgi:CheY-like chemotaxis protein